MRPGDLVDDRFEVVRLAGSGGIGIVFEARDRAAGGAAVALKVINPQADQGGRFGREVEVLQKLQHPGVVRYVAHGMTEAGAPYLAMEWLEGEDLSARLERGRLSVPEAMLLAERVAATLAHAHAHGVVHRDVKPANLFLVGGAIERVMVLDFGIARLADGAAEMTRAGVMMGTPAYMAPEQARGQRDLDARADVFSLGCVLFECLTGQPPFAAADVMAVLARILLEDAPRLGARLPGAPLSLEQLLARMLAKDPERRPRDGAAVAIEIAAAADLASPLSIPADSPSSLTESELRVVSIVLVAPPAASVSAETLSDATLSAVVDEEALAPLRALATSHDMRLERLANGSLIGVLSSAGAGTDQAAQAARAALALRGALPDARIAIATGRALVGQRWPVGEVIDRAASLVRGPVVWGADLRAQPVRLDPLTAGLLDVRFDVVTLDGALALRGEHEATEARRTLLGKPTTCVGRDWELSTLEGLYRACVADSAPRAALIVGDAGIGKSRLRYELVRALGRLESPPEVWIGRGDPMTAGAPFSLIAPALRRTAGIFDGEPIEVRREKLAARVAERVPEADRARVAEFLGELVGAPFPDADSVQLRAARADAALMGDQMKRAWEDFVAAETAARPLVLVLEDLHWGDWPTIKFVDVVLGNLASSPVCVIAIARPEIKSAFPDLWSGREVQEIRLGPLQKKGAERLAREALGLGATEATIARIVERAEGNAFYLEELIRAAAGGGDDKLPETVLAMVERRLEGLEPGMRRVLRAASVFGQVFWSGAVAALIGGSATGVLAALIEREILTRGRNPRFPGETELRFRHALVREAAYSMLTDGDRRLGHRLAGAWLESAGETDAMVLAEHAERGGELLAAAAHYRRAAEQALEANDFVSAIARARRGAASGASGEALGALSLIEAEAHLWNGDNAGAEAAATAAASLLPPGGEAWCTATRARGIARAKAGDADALVRAADALRAVVASAGVTRRIAMDAAQLVTPLYLIGRYAMGDALLDALDALPGAIASDPGVKARMYYGRAVRASVLGDAGGMFAPLEAAARMFEQAGHLRNAAMQRANLGYGLLDIGAYEEAERCLREALATAERLGLRTVCATAKHNLGLVLARRGAIAEGLAVEREAADAFRAQGDTRMEGASRNYLAAIHVIAGDLASAEREAREAVGLLSGARPIRAYALATLSDALLLAGRADEALAAVSEAAGLLEELGGIEEGEVELLVALAEARRATGDTEGAESAIVKARDRVRARAAKIGDAARREGFLTAVPSSARALAIAGALANRAS